MMKIDWAEPDTSPFLLHALFVFNTYITHNAMKPLGDITSQFITVYYMQLLLEPQNTLYFFSHICSRILQDTL